MVTTSKNMRQVPGSMLHAYMQSLQRETPKQVLVSSLIFEHRWERALEMLTSLSQVVIWRKAMNWRLVLVLHTDLPALLGGEPVSTCRSNILFTSIQLHGHGAAGSKGGIR